MSLLTERQRRIRAEGRAKRVEARNAARGRLLRGEGKLRPLKLRERGDGTVEIRLPCGRIGLIDARDRSTVRKHRRWISRAHGRRRYVVCETATGTRRIRMHRVIAEAVRGRPLPAKAVVHHHNGDGLANRRSNLVICEDQSYHRLLHTRAAGVQPERGAA